MASKKTVSPSTAFDSDVALGTKKSSIHVKRLANGKASVKADFHFRGLRYQLEATADAARARLEPVTHKLSAAQGVVFEATALRSGARDRLEIRLGKAVAGPRTLVLDVEPLGDDAWIGGYADASELLPMRAHGCGCTNVGNQPLRPLLAWRGDGSTGAVSVALPKAMLQDLGGLVCVMQATMTRIAGGGGVGDLLDIFDWAWCELRCVGGLLWCWAKGPEIPDLNSIFQTLCIVRWGACRMVCRVNRPF